MALHVLDSYKGDEYYQPAISRKSSLYLGQILGFNMDKIEEPTPKRRILLVDDQGFNIDAIKIILKYTIKVKDSDQICDTAFDGKQALDMVK